MNRIILASLFVLCSGSYIFSESSSLIGPQGLIITPTAYAMRDGKLQFGYSNLNAPNIFIKWDDEKAQNHLFYTTLVFLPRLELTGLLTFAPSKSGNDGSETYKDLAVFAQYHILKENAKRPGITLGLWDFHSYSYYNALFAVITKEITSSHQYTIYSHMGYGVDWIDTHWGDTGPDRYYPVPHHLVGVFGGIELIYQDIATLILEYDTSQFNAGIRIFLFDKIDLQLAAMEFKTFCFGINYRFSLLSFN